MHCLEVEVRILRVDFQSEIEKASVQGFCHLMERVTVWDEEVSHASRQREFDPYFGDSIARHFRSMDSGSGSPSNMKIRMTHSARRCIRDWSALANM